MKVIVGVIIAIILAAAAFLLMYHPQKPVSQTATSLPPMVKRSELQGFINPTLHINWKPEEKTVRSYQGKEITGKEQIGSTTNPTGSLRDLSNKAYLEDNAWVEDINLSADGPNGSQWGYTHTNTDGKKQVIIFGYTNLSFTPPPTGTTCPCQFTVSVFLSDPL